MVAVTPIASAVLVPLFRDALAALVVGIGSPFEVAKLFELNVFQYPGPQGARPS
jgi:hypothetical protein